MAASTSPPISPAPTLASQAIGLPGPRPAFGGYYGLPKGVTPYDHPDTQGKNGSDTSGGGDSGSSDQQLANDWYKALFASYGLPSDLQATIVGILTKYASNPTLGQALAQQTVRGSDWFKQTFPGFASGVSNGLFTDETGYRGYLNDINTLYNEYFNRHVSGDELAGYLKSGYKPGYIANLLQGQAYVQANAPDIQYLAGAFGNGQLNQAQLTALGNEQAGIDTPLGQLQKKILEKATQIHQKLFEGTLARPSMSLGTQGVYMPTLAGTKQVSNATNNPDIQA